MEHRDLTSVPEKQTKKIFSEPVMKVTKFSLADVIQTSGESPVVPPDLPKVPDEEENELPFLPFNR